jgi:hypothetical protein
MYHGELTNAEILLLLGKGISAGDTVFSKSWGETLSYNGVVFQSQCSCNYVGTYPPCPVSACPGVTETVGSFTPLSL